MAAPFIQAAFTSGEIAPALFGHVDLAKFHSAAATLRNCYVGFRGGAYSRAGTKYIGCGRQFPASVGSPTPRLIPFKFSIDQSFALEFGDHYMRIVDNSGFALEGALAITGATQANPCQITSPGHGYANGDWVEITGVGGMTQLNGRTFIVANSAANTFTLENPWGTAVDSTGYAAYTLGGAVARIYTLSTPYAAIDLPLLKFTQSADVMSFAHPGYPPYELSRLGPTNWTLLPAQFGAAISAPSTCTAVATVHPSGATSPPTLPTAYAYVVTAVDAKTGQESVASPIANVTDSVDIAETAGSLIVDWGPVAGAGSYNIYKAPPSYNTNPSSATDAFPVPAGALFGYVGTSVGTEFVDSNTTADFTQTPPLHKNPFAPGQVLSIQMGASTNDWSIAIVSISSASGSGFVGTAVIISSTIVAVIVVNPGQNYQSGDAVAFVGDGTSAAATAIIGPQTGTYPGVVSYFQERRVYAASFNNPDTYWMSQPGAFLDFDASIPVSDSDAISATPWSEQVNGIQWMVSMPLGLVTFTGAGIWQIGAPGSFASNPAAITPSNQIASAQSSIGSSATIPPIRNNWDILYVESYGTDVRVLSYQLFFNTYTGIDISWQSSHLLVGYPLKEWTFCEDPYKIVWACREDGMLLSLTYLREQEVNGWARHDTQGDVVSVCSIPEPPTDALYMIVRRYAPSGAVVFSIERMDDRLWNGVEDSWCVDAALATVLDEQNAILFASAGTGNNVTFTASNTVFNSGHVGQTLRMGGGIVLVTSYVGPTVVIGNWVYPCQELIPNDPGLTPRPQSPGGWSIAPQYTTITGLWHLVGKIVVGTADGVPVGPFTVAENGTIDLPFPASDVKIGLGFTAQVQSVYADTGQPTIQGRRKNFPAATVRVEASGKLQVGANQADSSALNPSPSFSTWNLPQAATSSDAPPTYTSVGGATVQPVFTGDLRAIVPAAWQKPGQIAIQQTSPLPMSVLAIIPEMLPGDTPEIALTERRGRQQQAA